MYIAKIYQNKQAKRMLLRMSEHFKLNGGQKQWRRPCVAAMTQAMQGGKFDFIRMSDGKRLTPGAGDALKEASRFYNLGGKHPHQNRPSIIAVLRAVADGDIDIADSEGKRFWE